MTDTDKYTDIPTVHSNDYEDTEKVMQNGGGLLNIFNNTNCYVSKLILDMFDDNIPTYALYILNHSDKYDVNLDYKMQGKTGKTILHWLGVYSYQSSVVKDKLIKILTNTNMSRCINKQDNLGNTIAHIVMYMSETYKINLDDVMTQLIKSGIDLNITNNSGKYIILEKNFTKKNKDNKEIKNKVKKVVDNFVVNTASSSDKQNDNVVLQNVTFPKTVIADEENEQVNVQSAVSPLPLPPPPPLSPVSVPPIFPPITQPVVQPTNIIGGGNSDEIIDNMLEDFDKTTKNKLKKCNILNMEGGMNGTRKLVTNDFISSDSINSRDINEIDENIGLSKLKAVKNKIKINMSAGSSTAENHINKLTNDIMTNNNYLNSNDITRELDKISSNVFELKNKLSTGENLVDKKKSKSFMQSLSDKV